MSLSPFQSWPDCTINTSGYDFRKGQALSDDPKGTGRLEALAGFMSNPAGAAIVNTVGPIRQITQGDGTTPKRYLVIARGTPAQIGEPVQVQP